MTDRATCGIPGAAPLLLPATSQPPAPPPATNPNCWGANTKGQWGNGVITGTLYTPSSTANTSVWKQLSLSESTACGIMSSTGKLFCWGTDGSYGTLGDGSIASHYTPSPVLGNRQWKAAFAATNHVGGICSRFGQFESEGQRRS